VHTVVISLISLFLSSFSLSPFSVYRVDNSCFLYALNCRSNIAYRAILNAPFCIIIKVRHYVFPVTFDRGERALFLGVSLLPGVRNVLISKMVRETHCVSTCLSLDPPDKYGDSKLYLILIPTPTFSNIPIRHLISLHQLKSLVVFAESATK